MKKVLVISGHTDLKTSVANKAMCGLTQMDYSGYIFTGGVSYGNF